MSVVTPQQKLHFSRQTLGKAQARKTENFLTITTILQPNTTEKISPTPNLSGKVWVWNPCKAIIRHPSPPSFSTRVHVVGPYFHLPSICGNNVGSLYSYLVAMRWVSSFPLWSCQRKLSGYSGLSSVPSCNESTPYLVSVEALLFLPTMIVLVESHWGARTPTLPVVTRSFCPWESVDVKWRTWISTLPLK